MIFDKIVTLTIIVLLLERMNNAITKAVKLAFNHNLSKTLRHFKRPKIKVFLWDLLKNIIIALQLNSPKKSDHYQMLFGVVEMSSTSFRSPWLVATSATLLNPPTTIKSGDVSE